MYQKIKFAYNSITIVLTKYFNSGIINTWKGVEEVAKFTLYLADELNEEAKKMAKEYLLNKNNYIVKAIEEKIERDKKRIEKKR